MKKMNKKGFTMAELLIVVAIIAVLVAIAIPIFTSQLEKSREAVDAANLRAAYAEVTSSVLTGDTAKTIKVAQKQTKADWQTTIDWPAGFAAADIKAPAGAAAADYWEVKWDSTNEKVVAQ
ncbi:MAG: prepilin-type N-terminal cleavage/methylation domain-containing protein [Lachnospiraceae bacterium]|nr:prepilin-type N-terminal cleavage/methylation domain-containing protein [Lachnospiraceae bacterium]